MLIVRGVNVFPSAIEAIVRRFPWRSFQIEVFREGELDEVRVLVEVDGGEPGARRVQEGLRAGLASAWRSRHRRDRQPARASS
jgi:phenylacetate-CoA ligase